MATIHLQEIQTSPRTAALRAALASWGMKVIEGPGEGTLILVGDRPDPKQIPIQGTDILWWVLEGTPEEVSDVLSRRPGWVIRQESPMESVKEALEHLRNRDLGSEGWLRQMIHMATLEELLRPILARAIKLSSAKAGAIWVRSEDAFYQRVGEGYPEAPISMEEGAALVQESRAWLLCPGEQVALIRLREPHGDPLHFLGFIKDVEELLITAWQLENSRSLSFRDDLTVAHNRRCLEAELPQAIRNAASHREPISLLFLDVDNLKALNSRFGHPAGSRVLTTVAKEAQRMIRAQDRLYRYGGDEFCILMPGTQALGAAKLGERLIQKLTEPSADGIPISVSIGIASYPAHADGADHLLERADRALFKAKDEGKGRVVIAS
ncbi:GGDEF domain-containing protein [Holophaga foetida]|uniref:GGDEF domain-containing protein n=1 Tax=Holophaga foetida TaxID=35839 RepID=UPI0002472F26|nr:GGDEF domain-containing protein [Holophaga foetida]